MRAFERLQRGTIFRVLCLALPLAVGCQLTSADQVSRTPSVGHGTGGSSGRDMAIADDPVPDPPSTDLDRRDAPPVDTETSAYDGGVDRRAPSLDAGMRADADEACDDEPFCDHR